jgi:hypothetical protein
LTNIIVLYYVEFYHFRAIESALSKSLKIVSNIQKVLLIGTFRELNAGLWGKLLPTMSFLQSIELHFWSAELLFKIIHVST